MKIYSLIDFNQVLIGHSCVPITVFSSNKDSEDIRSFSNLASLRITWKAYETTDCWAKFRIQWFWGVDHNLAFLMSPWVVLLLCI